MYGNDGIALLLNFDVVILELGTVMPCLCEFNLYVIPIYKCTTFYQTVWLLH